MVTKSNTDSENTEPSLAKLGDVANKLDHVKACNDIGAPRRARSITENDAPKHVKLRRDSEDARFEQPPNEKADEN
jgi:hypothetical protein